MARVSPHNEKNQREEVGSSSTNNDKDDKKQAQQQTGDISQALKLFSIKTCLIFMTSMLIFISVITLSAIWISCFSPTVSEISSQVRDAEFRQIVSSIKQTMNEVTMVLETSKCQTENELPYQIDARLEQLTYNFYRSEFLTFHPDLVLAIYIGEPMGWVAGMILIDGQHNYFDLIRGKGLSFFPCASNDLKSARSCQRNSKPSLTIPYTSQIVSTTALKRPGGPIFTMSYADKSLPSITFLTLVTSYENPAGSNNSYPYSFHYGYDMSVGTVSKFLSEATKKISGSVAFTVELETGYIISSDIPDARVATWDDKGKETRKTPLNFDDAETVNVAKIIYGMYPEPKKALSCNTGVVLTSSMRYISLYRFCTDTNIDWLIAFSVPQWNYIGTMVIAIVVALLCGFLITIMSIIVAVFMSVRIVKPFHNLITAFESVASMKLDGLSIAKTHFKEVRLLQYHFMKMVASIEKYRSFIPAHLLSEMEDAEAEEIQHDDATSQSSISMAAKSLYQGLSQSSGLSIAGARNSMKRGAGASHISTDKNNHQHEKNNGGGHVRNRFALYLEKRKVSVACLRIEGLGHWISHLHHQEVVNLLSDVFDQIGQVNKTSGGQAGAFENVSLLIYFNASKDQNDYVEKAITTSANLNSKLCQLREKKWKNMESFKNNSHLLNQVTFRMASSIQETTCGNVGTKEAKSFAVLGSVSYNIDALLECARELNVNVVISESMKNVCNTYHTRYIDTIDGCTEEVVGRPSNIENEHQLSRMNIYEVGESISIESDEWMYELQQQEKKEKWKKYNEAIKYYFENCFDDARLLLNDFIGRNPNDLPAKKLVAKIDSDN